MGGLALFAVGMTAPPSAATARRNRRAQTCVAPPLDHPTVSRQALAMILAAILILIPLLLVVWLILTIDKGVIQLRRIADELHRQRQPEKPVDRP